MSEDHKGSYFNRPVGFRSNDQKTRHRLLFTQTKIFGNSREEDEVDIVYENSLIEKMKS